MAKERDMFYCRLYSDMPEDDKLAYIADVLGQPLGVIIGAWSVFMAFATRSPSIGRLYRSAQVPWTVPMLARKCGYSDELMQQIVDQMIVMDMLGWEDGALVLVNFAKRNPKSDHDGADRTAASRARNHPASSTPEQEKDVTLQSCDSNVTETGDVTLPSNYNCNSSSSFDSIGVGESEGEGVEPGNIADERQVARITKAYEENIGLLSPLLAQQLHDLLLTYPPLWIIEAIGEACKHEKRSLAYVEGILRDWKREGLAPNRSAKGQQGERRGAGKDPPPRPAGLNAQQEAAYQAALGGAR